MSEEWERSFVYAKTVTCCRECPSCCTPIVGFSECEEFQERHPTLDIDLAKRIENKFGIPDWCPRWKKDQEPEKEPEGGVGHRYVKKIISYSCPVCHYRPWGPATAEDFQRVSCMCGWWYWDSACQTWIWDGDNGPPPEESKKDQEPEKEEDDALWECEMCGTSTPQGKWIYKQRGRTTNYPHCPDCGEPLT